MDKQLPLDAADRHAGQTIDGRHSAAKRLNGSNNYSVAAFPLISQHYRRAFSRKPEYPLRRDRDCLLRDMSTAAVLFDRLEWAKINEVEAFVSTSFCPFWSIQVHYALQPHSLSLLDHDCCIAQWPIAKHATPGEPVVSCVLGFGSELHFDISDVDLSSYLSTGALRVQLHAGDCTFTGTVQWPDAATGSARRQQSVHLLSPTGVHVFSLSFVLGISPRSLPPPEHKAEARRSAAAKPTTRPAPNATELHATYLPPALLWSAVPPPRVHRPPSLPQTGAWTSPPSARPPAATRNAGTQTRADMLSAASNTSTPRTVPLTASRASQPTQAGEPSPARSNANPADQQAQRNAHENAAQKQATEQARSSLHRLFRASFGDPSPSESAAKSRSGAAAALELDWPLHGTHASSDAWGTSSGTAQRTSTHHIRHNDSGRLAETHRGHGDSAELVSVGGRKLLTTASMQATASHEPPVLQQRGVATTGFGFGPTPSPHKRGGDAFPAWIRSYTGAVQDGASVGSYSEHQHGLRVTGKVQDVTEIGQTMTDKVAYADAGDDSRLGSSIAFSHRRSVTLKGVLPATAADQSNPQTSTDLRQSLQASQREDHLPLSETHVANSTWRNTYVHKPIQPAAQAPLSAGASAVGTLVPNRIARTTRSQALREQASRLKLEAMQAAADGKPAPRRKKRQPRPRGVLLDQQVHAPAVAPGTPLPGATTGSRKQQVSVKHHDVPKAVRTAASSIPPRPQLPKHRVSSDALSVLAGAPVIPKESQLRQSTMERAWRGDLTGAARSMARAPQAELNTSCLTEASTDPHDSDFGGYGLHEIATHALSPPAEAGSSSPRLATGQSASPAAIGQGASEAKSESLQPNALSLADVFKSQEAAQTGELLSSTVHPQEGFAVGASDAMRPHQQTALDVLGSPADNQEGHAPNPHEATADTSWLDNYAMTNDSSEQREMDRTTSLAGDKSVESEQSYSDEDFEVEPSGDGSASNGVELPRQPRGLTTPLRIDALRGSAAMDMIPSTLDSSGSAHDSDSTAISDSMQSGTAGGLSVDISAIAAGIAGRRAPSAEGASSQVTPPTREEDEEPQAILQPTPHAAAAMPSLWPSSRSDNGDAGSVGRPERALADPQTPSAGAASGSTGQIAKPRQPQASLAQRHFAAFAPTAARVAPGSGVYVKQRLHAKPAGAPPSRRASLSSASSTKETASPRTPTAAAAAEGSFVDSLSESSFGEMAAPTALMPGDDVEVDWSISVSQGMADDIGSTRAETDVGHVQATVPKPISVPQAYPPSLEGQGLSPRPGSGHDLTVPEFVRRRSTSALSSGEALLTLDESGDDSSVTN